MKHLNRVVFGAAAGLSVALAGLTAFTSVGFPSAVASWDKINGELTSYKQAQVDCDAAKARLQASNKAFDASRSFELYYGDVDSLRDVLTSVAGIRVEDTEDVDPLNGFTTVLPHDATSEAKAIKFSLVVDDTATALKVLGKMQLPIYSITIIPPTRMEIILLTGGSL